MTGKRKLISACVLVGLALVFGDTDDGATEGGTTVDPPVPAAVAATDPAVVPSLYPAAREMLRYGRPGVVTEVVHVIDGDTFVVTGGQRVRPLGIDSCEAGTPGGEDATEQARSQLNSGALVKLIKEPGVETDQYGRLLRYVELRHGSDFGTFMVQFDHTAVYQGKNDASTDYLAKLRATDYNGRRCEGPPPPPPVSTEDDNYHVPDSNDDNDSGGRGESRFCSKRRWC